MKGIFLNILYAFKRDSVFIGTTFIVFLISCFSMFLGSNAVVEAQEAKIIYTAGFSRIAIILGFITFVIVFIKRMFENHEIEVILSHSISRTTIILSMFFAFSIILLTLIFPVFIILYFLQTNILNVIMWCFSLYCEGILMLSFTLCSALIINSFVHSLSSCFLIYLIGRTIGNFVAYITISAEMTFQTMIANILKITSIFIPRLDLFGKTSWLTYGNFTQFDIFLFLSQTIIFCCIFLCIANIDLRKKEF